MKKSFHIKKTFVAIRQMPIEISFEQVQQWVKNQPINLPKKNWFGVFKDFLFSQN